MPGGVTAVAFLCVQSGVDLAFFALHVRGVLTDGAPSFHAWAYAWLLTYAHLLLSYCVASFSDPGFVAADWAAAAAPRLAAGDGRFCAKCAMPCPLRAAHCSVCERCVAMHDHHCFFIGNCVGARNFRAFLNLLIAFPAHAAATMVCAFHSMGLPGRGGPHALVLAAGMLYFVCFTLIVLTQAGPQILFAVRNSNWEELDSRAAAQRAYRDAGIEQVWEFDTGSVVENLRQRLGRNPLLWCVPLPNDDPPVFTRNGRFVPIKREPAKPEGRSKARAVAV
jgi:hypothetical protein